MEQTATAKSSSGQLNIPIPAFLKDLRVIQAIAQIVFVILFFSAVAVIWSNVYASLQARNLLPNFTFLGVQAAFEITESPAWYTPNSTFGDAFLVGIINTLRVVTVGLVLATVLGVLVGIALLSTNFMLRSVTKVYVEILRNTPLLVQLIFWYFVVMFSLPENDIRVPEESVFVLSYRLLAYVPIFGAVWGLNRRLKLPQHTLSGALLGAIALEVALGLLGYRLTLIVLAGILGAALFFLAVRGVFPASLRGYLCGGGLLAALHLAAVLLIEGLKGASVLPPESYSEIMPVFFITRKSFVMPELAATANTGVWLAILAIAIVLAAITYIWITREIERTGRNIPRLLLSTLVVVLIAGGAWVVMAAQPDGETVVIRGEEMSVTEARERNLMRIEEEASISTHPLVFGLPLKPRFRFEQGTELTPEYVALLVGLVIYTSAFIGEIVRAGIQAVPYGQFEAARALGLSGAQMLQMIVLPQALRVIIPPLGNQYLNLSKNSTLAYAIAFSDTYTVGLTVMNQSGQSVTGFFLILVVYLSMSLIIAFFMNIVNGRFQFKTR